MNSSALLDSPSSGMYACSILLVFVSQLVISGGKVKSEKVNVFVYVRHRTKAQKFQLHIAVKDTVIIVPFRFIMPSTTSSSVLPTTVTNAAE